MEKIDTVKCHQQRLVAADVVDMLSLATTGQQVKRLQIYADLQALCLLAVGLYTLRE